MTIKPAYEDLGQRIRELESIETTCKKSENELDRFFNLSLDMLCIANANGYFKLINDSFEKTLHYSKKELYEHPYIHFVHPDDVDLTRSALDLLSKGSPVTCFENH